MSALRRSPLSMCVGTTCVVRAGGLLEEAGRKLSGNMPRTPFSKPSHHPSCTCVCEVRRYGRDVKG